MSQVATTKKLNIQEERIKVTGQFREFGSILQGTKEGECLGFHIELSLHSDESEEAIAQLVQLSRRICFTEAALTDETPVTFSHELNRIS